MGGFIIHNKETGKVALRTDDWSEIKKFISSKINRCIRRLGLKYSQALSKVNTIYEIVSD